MSFLYKYIEDVISHCFSNISISNVRCTQVWIYVFIVYMCVCANVTNLHQCKPTRFSIFQTSGHVDVLWKLDKSNVLYFLFNRFWQSSLSIITRFCSQIQSYTAEWWIHTLCRSLVLSQISSGSLFWIEIFIPGYKNSSIHRSAFNFSSFYLPYMIPLWTACILFFWYERFGIFKITLIEKLILL